MSLIDGLRRLLPLAGRASLELRTGVAANRFRLFSAQSPKEKTHGNLHYDQKVTTLEEEIPDAPGMFQTVGAMGAGAAGAIVVAAVGVWAVFKMSMYVAGEAGRSMTPQNSGKRDQ